MRQRLLLPLPQRNQKPFAVPDFLIIIIFFPTHIMYFQSVKTTLWVSLVALFFSFQNADAQRLQVQFQVGANFSEGLIKDNGQSLRETITHFDTIPGAQLGLAVNARIIKNFHLRVDANYRAYRTTFRTEQPSQGLTNYVLGNLYSEKFNFSLLPEYRFMLTQDALIKIPGYVFAGPVLSFEVGENYADTYTFPDTYRTAIKPDPQGGWCVGLGINPKWRRFGLLAEVRYTRSNYANEGLLIGEMGYQHLTVMTGLSVDLVK